MSEIVILNPKQSFDISTEVEQPKQNPALLYLLSLSSQKSREVVGRILTLVARQFGYATMVECEWTKMRHADLLRMKTQWEIEKLSPATINNRLAALKGVAYQVWANSQMSDHDYMVIKSLKGAKGSRLSKGRALTHVESSKLVASCEILNTNKGIRDAAIIALGIGCGLRRAEIAGIRLEAINKEEHSIDIIGKGNKERRVFCSPSVWGRVEEWLRIRLAEGDDQDHGIKELFCAVYKGDHVNVNKRLSEDSIYVTLQRRAKEFSIEKFAPHDLRRTFATRLFSSGADANLVRQAMGHSSIMTTQKYDKRGEDQLKRIVESLTI